MLPSRQRLGVWPALLEAAPVLGFYLVICLLILAALPERAWELKAKYLIALGVFNSWRYGWGLAIVVRSFIYDHYVFPVIRRQADSLPEDQKYPDRLYLVIATYREQPWISRRMLRSVLRAAARVPCKTTLYLSTGSEAEDNIFKEAIAHHPMGDRVEVILMRQSGKRSALGYALRSISRRAYGESSAVVLMDGDSALGADIFEKTLPLFKLLPRLGAITTNNIAFTEGSPWYRDWYNLRFSMRHRQMNAVSLSRRVLALTGRFSLFRTEQAVSEKFIRTLEADSIDHWLFGRIRFLTGDDKSTWFSLLRDGWEMLYVPDAMIYCLESSSDEPLRQSFAKMARWFGNMLRNNGRSIRLGPGPMGLYTWWSLIDQRLSIWTTLVGPCTAIILAIFKSPYYLVFYAVLAVLVRIVYLFIMAFEGHRAVLRDLPLLLFSQWAGSLVKIKVMANLGRQSWGKRTGDGKKMGGPPPTVLDYVERFQPIAWMTLFFLFLSLCLQF